MVWSSLSQSPKLFQILHGSWVKSNISVIPDYEIIGMKKQLTIKIQEGPLTWTYNTQNFSLNTDKEIFPGFHIIFSGTVTDCHLKCPKGVFSNLVKIKKNIISNNDKIRNMS